MESEIYQQTNRTINELFCKAKLLPGDIVVVGCSTSDVVGSKEPTPILM